MKAIILDFHEGNVKTAIIPIGYEKNPDAYLFDVLGLECGRHQWMISDRELVDVHAIELDGTASPIPYVKI